ncbi:SGNH hydrolase domain-containing protein [Microvirga makkahensis]|uniref:SGNH domain-containing protein n=1 Tax=Microvirga makkahensis TaxID=1128670 RepID=A0A7X3MTG2_9HYPH|nr:hypothetical protein [Microvirga makkahensis]
MADTYLWGGSHVGHDVGILSEIGEEVGFTFRNAVHSACPPLLPETEQSAAVRLSKRAEDCRASRIVVRDHLHQFSKITLAARWGNHLNAREGFAREAAGKRRQNSAPAMLIRVMGDNAGSFAPSSPIGRSAMKGSAAGHR